ncbi:hypothetical protein [Saccharothrix hoggarensis]|uniref:Peptidase inhibitor I9 n=1 Tax=Saccharothrix hoggarensis TaxID=913853 RepID=A0ABW3QRR2_9PSEU
MRTLVAPLLAVLVLAGCAERPTTDARATATGDRPAVTGDRSPATGSPTATSEVRVPAKLSPQGEDVLAKAERSGVKTVVLTLATERGKTDQVISELRRLGGAVEADDTSIGYVRVAVPVEVARQVPAVAGVSQVDVDEPLSNADPTP